MMRNRLCCSALVLLTVFGSGGTVAGRCRWGQDCVCLQCPAGQEPSKACGHGGAGPEDAVCQPCPAGTFSDAADAELCLPHASCEALRRKVATPGTSDADAVCGDCLPGFHQTPASQPSLLLLPCEPPPRVRSARTAGGKKSLTGGGAGGGGPGGVANGTAVRSAEEKSAEYAVFALVPVFCVMGLLGILICNILKKKGYRCTADKDATNDPEVNTPPKEANGCPYIADDPNEDTISVLVRLITEKKENAAALEELLLEYESNQLALSKASSIKFPVLSPLSQFQSSAPRLLCPHQSHLHTISGLSGLAGRRGNHCSRCAQRKWPPVLLAPLGLGLKARPPPQSPPGVLDPQKSPLLEGMCTDSAHHVQGEGLGELTVLSVGRFQVAQIPEQKPALPDPLSDPDPRDSSPSRKKSSLLDLFSGPAAPWEKQVNS